MDNTTTTTIVSTVTDAAGNIVTDATSMLTGVAPILIGLIGLGIVLSLGIKYVKKMKSA